MQIERWRGKSTESRHGVYLGYVFEDRPCDQRTSARMQASTKILSRRLAVIEMAFAAVYSVVHAARRRQKGFDLAANFLGENEAGGKAKGRERTRGGLLVTRHSYYFPATSCARATLFAGTQMAFVAAKGAANRKTPHLLGEHAHARSPTILNAVYESTARLIPFLFVKWKKNLWERSNH